MKLYATVTSERASKGQGGNERIEISICDETHEIASVYVTPGASDSRILIRVTGEGHIGTFFVPHETKGEQKKGECAYASVDGAFCTTHNQTH